MAPERGETALARDLREGKFVVSVQIDPPLGGDYTGLLETVEAIRESGSAGYVDINDNATASAKLSAMIMAAAIERHAGVETIPHLTSRDYSVMGLEALLLGGHAEGVRNILAVTGDPPEVGDYPGSKGIYEVDAIGLTQVIAHLNAGQSYNGKVIDAPTSFFIGVAVNPTADDLELEADRFHRKVEAGAQFAMTQILFDLRYLDEFRERLGGSWPIPVLVGIFPLSTYRLALRLHNEVPGIVVPDALQAELRDAGPSAAEIGTAHARELVRELRETADGIYIATPFRRPLAALEVLLDN
jgi:methionine synthase / methylenetetrahydrofolate reductase (NADH)